MSFLKIKVMCCRKAIRLCILSLVALALLAGCSDGKARVIFVNQSNCGTIRATLTNTQTGVSNKVDVPIGQRIEVIVEPDVFYEYIVDFTAAGRTADNFRCIAVESGRVSVPAGTSQTFTLTAQTPTPSPNTPTP